MYQLYNNILYNYNKNYPECLICFDNKKLESFCKNDHKICKKCCKDWLETNILCPVCRQPCNNINYMKYNCEFENIEPISKNNLEIYLKKWHKQTCIYLKHKFIIRNVGSEIVFLCDDCWVEQSFKRSKI